MTIYFLSDLHLCDERPQSSVLFVDFLNGPARRAQAVYILGDLLEYWVGDDTLKRNPPSFVGALQRLTQHGVPTFLMHGNRDFLLGAQFAAATGCVLIDDPTLISLFGTPTLLMHGDTLCTDGAAKKFITDGQESINTLARCLLHENYFGCGMKDSGNACQFRHHQRGVWVGR